ncbi:hypothetical protein CAEBREN_09756 [Caenorhabditis brenneri]|uniref:Uncharacterized protein n=1 Tax=Caenorhabditis brenneri TaxID=135651 RepID=G0MY42_CAEBE|nr:hypothetical protein CAEBREN_09756 [Caenorhabditis brenneri]
MVKKRGERGVGREGL